MALKQNRSGIVFNDENFPPAALATEIYTYTPGPPITQTMAYQGPKMLVDAFGGPIFFYRWPTANPDFGNPTFGTSTGAAATANSPVASALRSPTLPILAQHLPIRSIPRASCWTVHGITWQTRTQ